MTYYIGNTETVKFCSLCEQFLDRSNFYKDSSRKDGVTAYCKICKRSANSKWREANPNKVKQNNTWNRRQNTYGVDKDIFEKMLYDQNFQCKICFINIDNSAHVDHDHETGRVRGVLCRRCNVGLGFFKDSIKNLKSAIEYLI